MRDRQRAFSFAFLFFLLVLATGAEAWEFIYGPETTREKAFRRVSPVVHCPLPGYIAVGTLDDGLDPQLYVVFTDLGGNPGWESLYDVRGWSSPDEGIALVELPNAGGFVILSNSQTNGVWSPVLTRIPCDGGPPLWSYAYPDGVSGRDLRGRDLIRAANGDYVVAGSWWNGSDEDAFLLRTDAVAWPFWNRTYDSGGFEAFHALAEADLQSGLVPDLVAVGRFNQANGDLQGLAARVRGANGLLGAAPRCLAHHGSAASQDVYHSVTRLDKSPYAGQFAMIGTTTEPGRLSDIWLTRGNPCALAAQSRIGNPLAPSPTVEEGYDVREAAGPVLGPEGGLLAIAGAHGPAPGGPFDAAFHLVATASLLPFGANGRIFGDHSGADEVFYSLAQDPQVAGPLGTYILAGYTDAAWLPGDPRDLYLVHHDPTVPGCAKDWTPIGEVLSWPSSPLQASQRDPARRVAVVPRFRSLDSGFPICR